MSRLATYMNETDAGDYIKFPKDSITTIRLITSEPVFCLPVWIEGEKGKRKRLNSISVDRAGEKTKYRCPILPLFVPYKGSTQINPSITLVYGAFNFELGKVQLLCLSQKSILRALCTLEKQIMASNEKQKRKTPKTLCDYKIYIERQDSNEKTQYIVGFTEDATEGWTPEESEIVDEALDPKSPADVNIHKRIERETQWPTQEYLNEQEIDITLPEELLKVFKSQPNNTKIKSKPVPVAVPGDEKEITESDIPF